jgi:hypothetical protein
MDDTIAVLERQHCALLTHLTVSPEDRSEVERLARDSK